MGVVGRRGIKATRRLGGTSLATGGAEGCPATRLVKSAVRKARRRVRRMMVMVVPMVGKLCTLRDT